MQKTWILLSVCLTALNLLANDEILVNTYQDSTQRDPHIARDNSGNYVIVWNSEEQAGAASQGDIYMQLFDSDDQRIGSEQRVNTITQGDQEKPAVAMTENGDFVVVWASMTNIDSVYDIKARLYRNNMPLSPEFIVNSTYQHSQTRPDVDMDKQGNFVVVWDSWFQDGSDRGVFAQIFDADGNKSGPEFQVNTETAYSQSRPAVRFLEDGRFLVTWESWNQDSENPSGYGIFGQIFSNDGQKEGVEFQINTAVQNYQWFSSIEAFPDTSFFVAWCSWEQDGDDGGIYMQRFDKSGEKIGAERRVNYQTIYYQWLPRVKYLTDNKFAVIWSSWKQDGSREGIIVRFFDDENHTASLDIVVNAYKTGYQWEPDAIKISDNELLITWASWGEYDKDYEIKSAKISAQFTEGILHPSAYNHTNGISTSSFIVHVIDSTALTGDEYAISFDVVNADTALVDIRNSNSEEWMVRNFVIHRGEGFAFITPLFEGVRVEILPVFDFRLDAENARFINNSGSSLEFNFTPSSVGTQKLAPIDVALIWGNTNLLPNGKYESPLDTAMGIDLEVDIETPFMAWNLTDNSRMDLLVVDEDEILNNRWDVGERIVLFTPESYRSKSTDTHLEITTGYSSDSHILPAAGDSNLISTIRPIRDTDVFTFQTSKAYILNIQDKNNLRPGKFELYQNYPNPFNPDTKVRFQIPESGRVNVSIYNVLGQKVATLFDDMMKKGYHLLEFDGKRLASGMYFYVLRFNGQYQSKKMILVK
jgi:hypothetical protein